MREIVGEGDCWRGRNIDRVRGSERNKDSERV